MNVGTERGQGDAGMGRVRRGDSDSCLTFVTPGLLAFDQRRSNANSPKKNFRRPISIATRPIPRRANVEVASLARSIAVAEHGIEGHEDGARQTTQDGRATAVGEVQQAKPEPIPGTLRLRGLRCWT